MRALSIIALLLAPSAFADCIANGHYTIVGNASPMIGTRFPYTEDLSSAAGQRPIGAPIRVQHFDDLRWTKVQTGCAAFAETNVSASAPVNLLLRASFRIDDYDAPADARYQVQLRLGDEVVATETRRLGTVPRSDRFAGFVRALPAGNYVYSLWFRLLDGAESNSVLLDLQWITAQGAPSEYPAGSEIIPAQFWLDGHWQTIGHPLHIESGERVDLELQSSITIEEADDDAKLDVAFTVDGAKIGDGFGTLAVPASRPDALIVFDARPSVRAGEHTIRMWVRARNGRMRVSNARIDLMGFPSRLRDADVTPMTRAEAGDVIESTSAGSPEQPRIALGCGRYTKLLDFVVPPSRDDFSWSIQGYVEIEDVRVSGYGRLAIVNEHHGPDETVNAVTDMGIFEFQARPGGDGFFFYGDASKWGNDRPGDRMSLWISRIEGCRGEPLGGGFRVGRRWLAVKLLPSEGPHLP